jgi:17beta-estradiol 17-dehydrogenase / very-long-chain 3-oxoacyl-CoA reductase
MEIVGEQHELVKTIRHHKQRCNEGQVSSSSYKHTKHMRAHGHRKGSREHSSVGKMTIHGDGMQPAWFLLLTALGAIYLSGAAFRLLAHLARCLSPPTDLRGRYGAWAVITGPTSGIGRSMALELARRGLNLVLVGHDPTKLHDVANAIAYATRGAVRTKTVVFDLALASTAQGEEAARRLREAVDGLDVGVLVNNAGVARPCAVYLHEFDVEAWVRMVRVNLWALTEVTAAVLPGMVARGRGTVVNIGSGSTEAIPSFPLYSIYAATKRYPTF